MTTTVTYENIFAAMRAANPNPNAAPVTPPRSQSLKSLSPVAIPFLPSPKDTSIKSVSPPAAAKGITTEQIFAAMRAAAVPIIKSPIIRATERPATTTAVVRRILSKDLGINFAKLEDERSLSIDAAIRKSPTTPTTNRSAPPSPLSSSPGSIVFKDGVPGVMRQGLESSRWATPEARAKPSTVFQSLHDIIEGEKFNNELRRQRDAGVDPEEITKWTFNELNNPVRLTAAEAEEREKVVYAIGTLLVQKEALKEFVATQEKEIEEFAAKMAKELAEKIAKVVAEEFAAAQKKKVAQFAARQDSVVDAALKKLGN